MVIINGKIFTMEDEMIECGYVRIQGTKIEEVGEMESFEKRAGEQVLDVHGAWVLPGLIEAHAHVGITEEKWGIIVASLQSSPMIPHFSSVIPTWA